MILALAFLLTALSPLYTAHSAVADVGFAGQGIYFSQQTLYVGDTVRIYGRLRNFGAVDVDGAVGFYIGDVQIGNDRAISLPSGGFDEEVFIDFVVPSGPFNISARINAIDPPDSNMGNNWVQTTMFTPIPDKDHDSVLDESDNCPTVENQSQTDTDGDRVGDACDIDDDNDGVTDEMERELGTSPTDNDTDDDGLKDKEDPQPLVKKVEPVAKPVEPTPVIQEDQTQKQDEPQAAPKISPQTSTDAPSGTTGTVANRLLKLFGTQAQQKTAIEEDSTIDPSTVRLSPKAIFRARKVSWNTYAFEALQSDVNPVFIAWYFGDGSTSDAANVEHVFPGSGTYHVQLQVTNQAGEVDEDATDIHISFFHLANPVFLSFVIVLGILTLLMIVTVVRLSLHE
ncbi:PKD domain-containing protein [Candidatus Uhrbacteria bacterium]|nr:PKD domain-containing protein [Candidatus Uhrbacteria bacterium]